MTDALARLLAPPGRSSATAGSSLSTDGSPGTRRRRDLPQTRLRAARGMRVRVPDGALMPVIGSAYGRRHVALTGLQRSAEHRTGRKAKVRRDLRVLVSPSSRTDRHTSMGSRHRHHVEAEVAVSKASAPPGQRVLHPPDQLLRPARPTPGQRKTASAEDADRVRVRWLLLIMWSSTGKQLGSVPNPPCPDLGTARNWLLDHQGASLRSSDGAGPRCAAGRAASCAEPR